MKFSAQKHPKHQSSKCDSDRPIRLHIIDLIAWLFWVFLYLPIAALIKLILLLAELSPIPFERINSRKDMLAAFLLFCLATVIVIGEFMIPGNQPFEASLLVSHIQFTTPKPNSRFFLQNIDNLTSLDLQNASETLTLTGNFSSPENPQINSILSQKNELSLTFSEANSRLLIYPSSSQGLAIPELTLKSTLQMSLSYLVYPPENQLNLRLTSPAKDATEALATLQIKLNPEPFTLGLENVKIEGLDSPVTELEFTPKTALTRQLSLFSPTQLALNFAENTQPERDWIGGNLPVTDVKLTWVEQSGEIQNDIPRSSILKGEVRINDKTLTTQENQFLITGDAQDIEKLRYLALSSDPVVGMQVRLAGKSNKLEVGLDPDYPVQTLKSSWLSRYLTPDQVTAALSFSAAVIGFLLPYLFVQSSKN